MGSFNAENLIGQLLLSGLGGGSERRRRKRLARGVRATVLSPQGLSLLGGIALAAIEHLRDRGGIGPVPSAPPPPVPDEAREPDPTQRTSRILVRAMVEAAKADGAVDPVEKGRILTQLETSGADPEARAFVAAQLDRPLDLDGLLAWVGSEDPGLAAQVYVASRIVVADETPSESAYLALLASRLGLADELVRELRSQVDQALESVPEAE